MPTNNPIVLYARVQHRKICGQKTANAHRDTRKSEKKQLDHGAMSIKIPAPSERAVDAGRDRWTGKKLNTRESRNEPAKNTRRV